MTILNSQENRKDNIRYVLKTTCYTFVFMENIFGNILQRNISSEIEDTWDKFKLLKNWLKV